MNALTRGVVAKKANMGIETVRFYEKKGLIPRPDRSSSGYRQYPEKTIQRLRFIRQAKDLGFSLAEISDLLNLRVNPKRSCKDVKKLAEKKVKEIKAKILELQSIQKALSRLAAACRGKGPTTECPILESLDMEKNK